jgi:predicted NUDIX family NTP pyrophosphohydrolase
MKKQSGGVLLYRQIDTEYQVLLAHPGGPFWAKKDVAAWSIPKGETEEGETLLDAARREFQEEMGAPVPEGELIELGTFKQSSSKDVTIWMLRADFDLARFKSQLITIEWPPKSGQQLEIPENDKATWMRLPEAQLKLFAYQVPILEAFCDRLGITADPPQIVPLETFTGAKKNPPPSPPAASGGLKQTSLF